MACRLLATLDFYGLLKPAMVIELDCNCLKY